MSIVIFSGPTISPQDVAARIDAVCLPPVAQGDIWRAMELEPQAIGIIDGYFQGVPSAWHKEILWALSRGVAVFGSASMGALRAAELHSMGMIGVGQIFEDYRSGILEDDDEVAVQHGPAELNYRVLGVPMVNLRATVARALDARAIDAGFAEELLGAGKAMHYKDRTWDAVIGQLGQDGGVFADWLKTGHVDQKRVDAEAMIDEMQRRLDAGLVRPATGEPFEWTLVWQRLLDESAAERRHDAGVLDELRLQPELYVRLLDRARLRALILEGGEAADVETSAAELSALRTTLRERLGLFRQARFTRWLTENDLSAGELETLLAEDAHCQAVVDDLDRRLGADLLALTKLEGEYDALKQRAADKADVVGVRDADDPALARCGLLGAQLVAWYFRERLGRRPPAQAAGHARMFGFTSVKDFHESLAREYLYHQARDKTVEVP